MVNLKITGGGVSYMVHSPTPVNSYSTSLWGIGSKGGWIAPKKFWDFFEN